MSDVILKLSEKEQGIVTSALRHCRSGGELYPLVEDRCLMDDLCERIDRASDRLHVVVDFYGDIVEEVSLFLDEKAADACVVDAGAYSSDDGNGSQHFVTGIEE